MTSRLPLLSAIALLVAAPLAAQEAELPALPDPLSQAPLPPLDLGEPIILPPVQPLDPALTAPLQPLEAFDVEPRQDFVFTATSEEGIRYSVTVEGLEPTGLEPPFRRLSALVRGERRPATAAQIASRANSDQALMLRLLHSEGWYSGTADAEISVPEGGGAAVRMLAVPGERYRWRRITLDLIPDTRPELRQGFGLKVGDPIRAIAVEEAEGALLRRMLEAGYPFAEIGARDVVLDAEQPTGTYLLTGDLGPEGLFGQIRMTGFQPFDERHAQVIARFEPGEPYDIRLVDDLRRALIATQLFGGVTVTPVDTGLREPDGRAVTDIRITGNPGPLRRLDAQIGYSSGEGFRAEAVWRHRNLLPPEGAFEARGVVGTIEQRAAVGLVRSNFGQRDRTLALGLDAANLTRPAFQARTLTLGAAIGRASTPIWQKRWTWEIGAELIASDERDRSDPDRAEVRRVFLIAALPGRVGYDRSDDLLDPTRGYRLALALTPELSRQSGDIATYARAIADASAYRPFGERFVLAGRLRLGTIVGAGLDSIAPTRRLYAGGGGSVRGFDYQGVGPIGESDRPTGGRGLFEASVEGRYRFGNFGVVGFVDAGSLTEGSAPTLAGTRFGVGVGGRYYTSFGPIRIDIARAIDRRPRDPKVALYISIGQAF